MKMKPIYQKLQGINIANTFGNRISIRIASFDPAVVYERIQVDVYSRRQENLSMEKLFPKRLDNVCGCGCEAPLVGRRTRWATEDCAIFASAVYGIIYGGVDLIRRYKRAYTPRCCESCGETSYNWDPQLDHIIPVCLGGGGCWLNNYQFLCPSCHKQKTKLDNETWSKRKVRHWYNARNAWQYNNPCQAKTRPQGYFFILGPLKNKSHAW